MTELLEKALDAARLMSPAKQDDLAKVMLSVMQTGDADDMTPEDWADVLEGLAEAERGEFATDAEVELAFRAFRE